MKRMPVLPFEHWDFQPNYLQAFTAMFPLIPFLILAAISGLFPGTAQSQENAANGKCPPLTRRDGTVETIHGVSVADPYRWLEDQNSPETRAWIEVQNACTQSVLKTLPGNEAITKRLTELIKVDTIGVPSERGGRYFYSKRTAGRDLFVLYMRRGTGPEEVLVNPASLSADHTTSVSLYGLSEDGKLVGYGVRKGGEDEVSVHLIDTDTRQELPDTLPRARLSGASFKSDDSGFYYSKLTDDGFRVYYHSMGTSAQQDKKIFGDGYGPGQIIVAHVSESGRYLLLMVIYGSACEKSEIYFQDLAKGGPITPIVKNIDSCFEGQIAGDTLYMETNWKAPNWHVLSVPLNNPAQENWKEIIPEGESRLEDFQLAGGQIIGHYSHNASSELKVFEADGRAAGNIALPALGDVSQITGKWRGSEAFLSFQSFAIPATVYRYDVSRHVLAVWAKPSVPVDATEFEVKQIWYQSKDKTRVPMFLFYKKGLKLDGSNPALMTAYGGFDSSETPEFRDNAVVWAEHGGVFAMPNLRGGGEFGDAWHHAGMLEKKQNVFDDFFAAAEWLIANHYTSAQRLSITGEAMAAC